MAEAPALKKALFEMIWSFEDEIQLLKGFDEYHESLSFQVTSVQLLDKLRRLKNTHSRLSARAKNGTALKFAKPHDLNLYELSKKVWGKGGEHEANAESNGVAMNGGGMTLKRECPFLMKEAMAKMGNKFTAEEVLKLVGLKKAWILEKKLKQQKGTEMKNNLRKMDLLKESIKLVMEAATRD